MWAALKSDFSEVVFSIKEEGAVLLEDRGNNDSEEEESSRDEPKTEDGLTRREDENFIVDDDGMVIHTSRDGQGTFFEETGIVSTPADQVAYLRGREETYLGPLVPWEINGEKLSPKLSSENDNPEEEEEELSKDVEESSDESEDYSDEKQFLEQISIQQKSEEIASALETYPDTVKHYFEEFVPETVTFEQFWQRYFFRCDVERVEREWQKAEEERLEREKRRREMIQQGVNTATSMFGGAIRSIGQVISTQKTSHTDSTFQKYQKEVQDQNQRLSHQTSSDPPQKGTLGFGLFGQKARLPFVLDTTNSSDEEVEQKISGNRLIQDDDDDEEELGWDSGDDDDDDEEHTDNSGTIEFLDVNKANLQANESLQQENDQLKKTVRELTEKLNDITKERDTLYETVETHTKEMNELKILQSSTSSTDNVNDLQYQVKKLQMQLFEKESEHAAMTATLLNNSHDDGVDSNIHDKFESLQKELDCFKNDLKCRDENILRLENENRDQTEKYQRTCEDLSNRVEEVNSLKSDLEKAARVNQDLSHSLSMENERSAAEKSSMEQTQLLQEESIAKLKAEFKDASHKNNALEETVKKLKQQLQELQKSDKTETLNSSLGKVEPQVKPVTLSADDDDDWGDSWGDEDV